MNMSRKATNEYIGVKRRAYEDAKLVKRIRILDEVCETTGYSRKYANRLLTGSRKFHELVEKIKRKHGKGYTCKYDKPQTQYARALAASEVPQSIKEALQRRKSKINGIELYHKTKKILHRIRKVQELSEESSPGDGTEPSNTMNNNHHKKVSSF